MMVYNLLVVDDERHVVDSLCSILDRQSDMDINLYKANSGQQALAILAQSKIDIVLLDIKMPGLSGLQVYQKISQLWPNIQVIFLTAHASFDHIYEVSKDDNVSYLLKLENKTTIIETIRASMYNIEQKRKNLETLDKATQMEILARRLLSREILLDILSGKPSTQTQTESDWLAQECRFATERQVFMIYGRLQWNKEVARSSFDCEAQLLLFQHYLEHEIGENFHIAVLRIDNSCIIILLQPTATHGLDTLPPSFLRESMNELVLPASSQLLFKLAAVLCTDGFDWRSIAAGYEGMKAYFYHVIEPKISRYGIGAVVDKATIQKAVSSKQPSVELDNTFIAEQMSHSIYSRDKKLLASICDRLEKSFYGNKSMYDLPTMRLFQGVGNALLELIDQNALQNMLQAERNLHSLCNLNAFPNWPSAFRFIKALAFDVLSLLRDRDVGNAEKVVHRIKKLIEEDLAGDLSLSRIATYTRYNSSYISRLFRQVTGNSISNYIAIARIEKAKAYLENTNMPIHEIAERTGFDSPQYFSIVFKKTVGVSPKEYRVL